MRNEKSNTKLKRTREITEKQTHKFVEMKCIILDGQKSNLIIIQNKTHVYYFKSKYFNIIRIRTKNV